MNRRDFVRFAASGVAGSLSAAVAVGAEDARKSKPEKPKEITPKQIWRDQYGGLRVIIKWKPRYELWENLAFSHFATKTNCLCWIATETIRRWTYLGTIEGGQNEQT